MVAFAMADARSSVGCSRRDDVTAVKYALTWPVPLAAYGAAGVIVSLGIAGIGAAAIVPAG